MTRNALAIFAALLVAAWSFVGQLWLAYLVAQANAASVRGAAWFLPVAAVVVATALGVAIALSFWVYRRIRGKR